MPRARRHRRPEQPPSRSTRALARRLALLAASATLAIGAAAASAPAAGGDVDVTLDMLTSTSLVNDCLTPAASSFGTVVPGGNARTATGANVCRVTFGSNDPAQLRIGQADGVGTAMGLGITAPTVLAQGPAAGRIIGVFGANSTLAYGVGLSNTIFRTMDGGATGWWEGSVSACSGGVQGFDVEMLPGDPNTWWVVGENRILCRTTNGQASPFSTVSWSIMSPALASAGWPASGDINELTIPDANTIFIGGETRWLGKMNVGAGTWTAFQHADATVGDIVSIDAQSTTRVMALATNGKVLYTTTGATASAGWSVTTLPGSPSATTDVAMASTTRAYAVGRDGYLAVWDGAAWTDRTAALAMPADACGVDSLPGSPDSVMVLDCTGIVHRSTDAGLTWAHSPTGTAANSTDIHAANANDVYAVAASRTQMASHDGGVTWNTAGPSNSEELSTVAVSPIDGKRILAVGANAFRSTDRGASWASAPALVTRGVRGVTLVGDSTGWAVGDGAAILRTTDLGATWSNQTPPAGVTATLLDVAGLGLHTAVAVGMDGTIIGTTDGGATWTARSSGTTRALTGIARVGGALVAVGARGTVLRSTDEGATWTAVTGGSLPDSTLNLLDVAAASTTTVYAIGRSVVWRSTDQGATWTVAASVPTIRARSVAARSHTVVLFGYDDRVEYSTDDGATFTGVTGATGRALSTGVLVDSHTAFAVGANAIRMRMDVDPAPDVQVPDWTPGTNDWDSGGFFGVCLQDTGGDAIADWTEDVANAPGLCEALDSDPWQALPATATVAAHTSAAGTGHVDLVWGFRPDPAQRKGTYEAGIAFEAIAP